jgi:two-component system, chemotaxis family, chemotaxis protein CheY
MRKKILFVEDSVSIRKLVKYTLETKGYDVILSENGKEALNFLTGQKLDAIITDLYMPEMDGIELIKIIRKMSVYQETPILLLTTESQITKIVEAKEAGATGWIIKPFGAARLLETIGNIVES